MTIDYREYFATVMAESMDTANSPLFGRAFREKYFMFKPGFIHLNQGELHIRPD